MAYEEGDMIGQYTIIGFHRKDKKGNAYYIVSCTVCDENVILRNDKLERTKHCQRRKDDTGASSVYRNMKDLYKSMIRRCYKSEFSGYKYYGGRGIKVCDRWLRGENGKTGFICFREDMGGRENGMTLDRIDVDRDYCAENCRWANMHEQQLNKRRGPRDVNKI